MVSGKASSPDKLLQALNKAVISNRPSGNTISNRMNGFINSKKLRFYNVIIFLQKIAMASS